MGLRPIFAALLLMAGTNAFCGPIAMSSEAFAVWLWPVAATDGKRIGVVWEDAGAIHGALVLAAAQRIESSVILAPGRSPSVSYGGGVYYIAWGDDTSVVIHRFASDGSEVDPAPLRIRSTPVIATAVAASDDGALVAWIADGYVVRTAFVRRDGMIETAPEPLHTSAIAPRPLFVAWNGSRFLLVFGQQGGICSFCINPANPFGVMFDGAGRALTGELRLPELPTEIAGGAGEFLVIVSGGGTSSYTINDDGLASTPQLLWWRTMGPLHILWNGSYFFALMEQFATRITPANESLDLGRDQPGPPVLPDDIVVTSMVYCDGKYAVLCQDGTNVPVLRILATARRRSTR